MDGVFRAETNMRVDKSDYFQSLLLSAVFERSCGLHSCGFYGSSLTIWYLPFKYLACELA